MDDKKILIVEDDDFLREIYIDTFKKSGYQVDFAVNGEQAYEKIKAGNWHILLLDIILPGANGIEIMKKLKLDVSFHIPGPVLFLTNLDNDAEMKEATSLGNGYLIKSQITPGDLIKEVERYLTK